MTSLFVKPTTLPSFNHGVQDLGLAWKALYRNIREGVVHGTALIRVRDCKAVSAFSVIRKTAGGNLKRHDRRSS